MVQRGSFSEDFGMPQILKDLEDVALKLRGMMSARSGLTMEAFSHEKDKVPQLSAGNVRHLGPFFCAEVTFFPPEGPAVCGFLVLAYGRVIPFQKEGKTVTLASDKGRKDVALNVLKRLQTRISARPRYKRRRYPPRVR
jgi:hypothetical protein